MSKNIPQIPNTKKWKPRDSSSESLNTAFLKNCLSCEKVIILKSELEKKMNIDNFDSGFGLEEIIREEFRKILPKRYSISTGIINDKNGKTAGGVDIVIFNDTWFPKIKIAHESGSSKVYLPIEGVYAVGEIKQTLDYKSLDEAIRKLVICHRLSRANNSGERIVENFELDVYQPSISNPLYSFILAANVGEGIDIETLIERFFDINKTLKRKEIIRAICVLGKGNVSWGYIDEKKDEIKPALFKSADIRLPIFPVFHKVPEVESAFFPLITDLLLNLYHSVLIPEDIAATYGYSSLLMPKVKISRSKGIYLEPD